MPKNNFDNSIVSPKTLLLFEKEKGGVGSTGTLVTVGDMLLKRGTPVVFIEASLSQLDVLNAYGEHHTVHQLALTDDDASYRLIDIVAMAPPGAAILANIPGGRFEEMDHVHQVVSFAIRSGASQAEVRVVWTMGLDAASRITLEAMLAGTPPGPVLLNLPAWAGTRDKFTNVDDELVARIEAAGGCVFVTPAMPPLIYKPFQNEEVALDRIAQRSGATMGTRVAIDLWREKVAQAFEGIF